MPADTTSGIHLGQPFDYAQQAPSAGSVDYVWGGADAGPPSSRDPAPWHENYLPWGRDMNHLMPWLQANHPDWIMYLADKSTPATAFGQTDMPYLDTTNPAVQAFIAGEAKSALGSGFRGISWDNGITYNMSGAAGHYDGAGRWVAQYSGANEDSVYAAAQSEAFAVVMGAIKAAYPNTSSTINQPFSCDPTWQSPVSATDMVVDEGTFMHGGDGTYATTASGSSCGNEWAGLLMSYQNIQKSQGKGLVILNEAPYTVTPYLTDSSQQARFDVQWTLANYLLVKYSHTYFWFGGSQQYGGALAWQREYSAPIGSPTDDAHASQGVYLRDYSNGLAIVNPDPSQTRQVTLPPRTYHDLYGRAVGGLSLPPHSGAVLLGARH